MDTSPVARLNAALAGRYTLERELGRGGMATVYLAQDLKHDRPVALKVLRPELAAALGPERFLREVRITARLNHPHILPLLDSGEADGFLFYVMPYVAGESLRDRLDREKQLPLDDALQIAREVADALSYAHSHDVVHRDVKPENVLLESGHAVVADFGIARAISAAGGEALTQTGIAVGTPAYMSPEQGAGSRELDGRSDLYSLGCVLYEMLAGQPPFTGASAQAVLARQSLDPVPRLRTVRETVPDGLEAAVLRTLAKVPADRFATAREFAEALGPGGAVAVTRGGRAAPRVARWGALLLGAGAATLVAMEAFTRARAGGPAAPELVVEHTVPVATDPALEIDPALSPDGALLAFAAGWPSETRIYVRQVYGGRPMAIGDSSGGDQRWPRWSPDGQRVIYCVGRRVMVVPALGGPARPLVETAGDVAGADWSPKGQEIVVITQGLLQIVRLADGVRRTIGRFEGAHSPAWSPDGRRVALVSGNPFFVGSGTYGNSAVSTVLVVPVAGGSATRVTDGTSLAVSPAWLPDGRGLLLVSDRGGSRDAYALRVADAGRLSEAPVRVTAGLRPHSITLSRDGRRLGYSVYTATANIWSLPLPRSGIADASAATPVTRGSQVIEGLRVSSDGRWVYYDSDRSGRVELYRVPATGGEPTQLTDAPGGHYWPAPSPDGQELAFQSQRHGTRDIFVMPAAGGGALPVRVAPGLDNVPSWFPDGQRIGFMHAAGDLPDGYYVTARQGEGWSRPQRVSDWPDEVDFLVPDTAAVLFDYGDSLVSVAFGGGARQLLYARRDARDPRARRARYAPDGRIYFLGTVGTLRGLFAVSHPDGAVQHLVRFDDPSRQPMFGGWDTDGRRLYVTLDERQSDLWVADLRVR